VEGFEVAVGGGADGSGAIAQDVAGGGGVEAEDGSEQDGFGLVRGQGGDQGDGVAGGDGVEGALGGVVGGGPGGEVLGGQGQGRGAAGDPAQVVQGAVPGDGGDPAAEPVVAAGEALGHGGPFQLNGRAACRCTTARRRIGVRTGIIEPTRPARREPPRCHIVAVLTASMSHRCGSAALGRGCCCDGGADWAHRGLSESERTR
jgi:hypothetical protein